MPLLPSYWRTSNSSADILKCYNEAACTPPTNSTDVCALNHVGPFCEMCAEGFALATGACVSCKDGKAGSLVVCVMVLFLLCAVGWCVYSIKDREEVGAAVGAGGLFVKRFKLPAKLLLQVRRRRVERRAKRGWPKPRPSNQHSSVALQRAHCSPFCASLLTRCVRSTSR